jgi:hypothetical protein
MSDIPRPCLFGFVIPVLARRSASARRRVNGNPGVGIKKRWIPASAGMTNEDKFRISSFSIRNVHFRIQTSVTSTAVMG